MVAVRRFLPCILAAVIACGEAEGPHGGPDAGVADLSDPAAADADAVEDAASPPPDASSLPDGGVVHVRRPVSALGYGDGSPASVSFRTIVGPTWLYGPSDIAFPLDRPDRLWVADHAGDALVLVDGLDSPHPLVRRFVDYAHAFGRAPTSLAIGRAGAVATCPEWLGPQGASSPLAGPALWPGDPDVLEVTAQLQPGGGWLEAMRSTPLCMGIEARGYNAFYAANGLTGDIDYYDFERPAAPGGPTRGHKLRMAEGVVARVEGVPGHLAFDPPSGRLYIADPGGGRVMRLDTQTGSVGKPIFDNPDPGISYFKMKGVIVEEHLPPGAVERPSGLAMSVGYLLVADHATGQLHAFDGEGGLVQSLDSGRGPGALAGIAVDASGRLYFADQVRGEVVRVEP